VFLTTLSALPSLSPALANLLAPKRREKALAFVQDQDRERSILAGLLLRLVLGVKNDDDLIVDPGGRPRLAKNGPDFSLSHSGPYVALSVGAPIHGLDIQETRSKPIRESLAHWALSPAEIDLLGPSPEPNLFIRLWTMKEAYVKALGLGLASGLNSFSVLPLESGPRLIAGQQVYFHLANLPQATLCLASLAASFPPLIIDISQRLAKLIKTPESLSDDPDLLKPLYRW
jgi:4'-phosphopantetheinyl transferase